VALRKRRLENVM